MATTNFSNGTLIVPDWLNDVDAMTYDQTIAVPWKTITWTNATVTHSGAHTWSGNQIYNGSTTFNGTLAGNIVSGTYTPTLTNTGNISASAANNVTSYIRIGNVVTVAGTVQITPTANTTATTLELSLPFASNFTSFSQCAGVGRRTGGTLGNLPGTITGNTTNDTANLVFLNDTDSGTSRSWAFQFQYIIA